MRNGICMCRDVCGSGCARSISLDGPQLVLLPGELITCESNKLATSPGCITADCTHKYGSWCCLVETVLRKSHASACAVPCGVLPIHASSSLNEPQLGLPLGCKEPEVFTLGCLATWLHHC
jgi:hypothetical protein